MLFAAPLNLLSGELREGELVELPFYEPWMVTNYGFITLKNHSTTPTVEKFMEEICAIEKELFIEEQALAATCLEKKR